MTLTPSGTARARFGDPASSELYTGDPEQLDLAYLGWEVARCARDLEPLERRALSALVAATLGAARAGSTRVPVDGRLDAVLEGVGAAAEIARARGLLERASKLAADRPLGGVLGVAGARAPLVLEGPWLHSERLRAMDERFCGLVRARLGLPIEGDERAVRKVVKAISGEPAPLTDEQRRAVGAALTSPLGLVTGGPGTGKTTIVVSILRALAWTGVPGTAVAVAAPTGKAAHRLQQAIDTGLASTAGDLADVALRAVAPRSQTLHALLAWSPSTGRFGRHENDPLPHRVVIVDEASMVDLALMDRLFRALRPDARLVLLGDADQLPSVEAGAVFRDLCATLPVARLTTNLRVASDPAARRIVGAAEAINAGALDDRFTASVTPRASVADVTFEGVELLALPWREVAAGLLGRWWEERVAALPDFRQRSERMVHLRGGAIAPGDAAEVGALLDHHAQSRLLCATRIRGIDTGAVDLNERLTARLRGGQRGAAARWPGGLGPGAPVLVERNDHERRLYNGDQGIVMRVDDGSGPAGLAAIFRRRDALEAIPLELGPPLAPAFAMTVHKAQGSEYDHVAIILPERDMTMLTRELLYTAVTRARRSVLLVGSRELLERAVARRIDRWTGVAEGLGRETPAPRPPPTARSAPRRSG